MIMQAVYSHLKANAALMAVCKWLYPHVIPQERKAPAMTYRLDADERDPQLAGQGDYRQALVTIDCYADSHAGAHAIAIAVESALIDYRGALGTSSPTVDADHIRLERKLDMHERDTGFFRVSLQLFIGYEYA